MSRSSAWTTWRTLALALALDLVPPPLPEVLASAVETLPLLPSEFAPSMLVRTRSAFSLSRWTLRLRASWT